MIESVIRRWLKNRKDALKAEDDFRNSQQFEASSFVKEHRTNAGALDRYKRGKRKSRFSIRNAKKPSTPR